MKVTDIKDLKMQQTRFFIEKEKVEKLCKQYNLENYTINNDLTVDVDGDVKIRKSTHIKFPLKFNKVTGEFTCSYNENLISLEGAPKFVGACFSCYSCKKLSSLQHCPMYIKTDFNITKCDNITSLHNIHTMVKEMGGFFFCDQIQSHMLGLCFIKGLHEIDHPIVGRIMNKHLHDVHMCQEALIDAGFSEYAKL